MNQELTFTHTVAEIRSHTLTTRIPDNFRPDNGWEVFAEMGGLDEAAFFVSDDGSIHRAVRVKNDIPLPCNKRALLLLKGGMLLTDDYADVVVAIQASAFARVFERGYSNGQRLVAMLDSPSDQAKQLMRANSIVQLKLQAIVSTPLLKACWRWREIKQEKSDLDLMRAQIAAHAQDLRQMLVTASTAAQ